MQEDRLSFDEADFGTAVAHGGRDTIRFARTTSDVPGSACNFIDLCILPAGSSIGVHEHGPDDEEIYVVVEGRGRMTVDDRSFGVGPGDVIMNRPGGSHGLVNDGAGPLRLVVVDVAVSA